MVINKKILAINGSASNGSSNLKLINHLVGISDTMFEWTIYEKLNSLPHFTPEQSVEGTPEEVIKFRNAVNNADCVLICTPEYVFSIPSGLKNAIEWCVSSTVFSNKPVGLITASANGQRGHEELKLIMKTIEAVVTEPMTLLISGIKGKIDKNGNVVDGFTKDALLKIIDAISKPVL